MSLIHKRCVENKKEWCCGCEIDNGKLCGEVFIGGDFYFICDKCRRKFE